MSIKKSFLVAACHVGAKRNHVSEEEIGRIGRNQCPIEAAQQFKKDLASKLVSNHFSNFLNISSLITTKHFRIPVSALSMNRKSMFWHLLEQYVQPIGNRENLI